MSIPLRPWQVRVRLCELGSNKFLALFSLADCATLDQANDLIQFYLKEAPSAVTWYRERFPHNHLIIQYSIVNTSWLGVKPESTR